LVRYTGNWSIFTKPEFSKPTRFGSKNKNVLF
jgi:hypothetical protein